MAYPGSAGVSPACCGAAGRGTGRRDAGAPRRRDFNSRPSQNFESSAGMSWIRIRCANNHALDSRRNNRFRAGRRAAVCAAGFERHVKRRAARIVATLLRVAERLNFRVWQARAPMPAAADGFAALHQHRAHHRIRRSRAVATPGKPEGKAYELGVSHRQT